MTKNLTLMIVLAFIYGAVACPDASAANTITFKNDGTRSGSHVLYVEIVPGTCTSPSPLRETMPVNPGETRTIPIPSDAGSACWIVSTYATVSQFPMYCGDANAGQTIVLDQKTPICNLTMENAKLVPPVGVSTALITGPTKAHVEYYLTAWNDPLTPPHTATSCIHNATGHWPWCDNWSTCDQWATQCQFLRNEAYLVIDSPSDIKTIVDQCLQKSACAAALAGVTAAIVTGGGALAAAEQAFTDVMIACLADQGAGVVIRFDIRSHWTPYGSCTK